jgi:hypothetical protein
MFQSFGVKTYGLL